MRNTHVGVGATPEQKNDGNRDNHIWIIWQFIAGRYVSPSPVAGCGFVRVSASARLDLLHYSYGPYEHLRNGAGCTCENGLLSSFGPIKIIE